ncbi:MAG: Na+:solute symporter [Archangiaceae bacterium]|nr:Na+:solute symporter [Archangiaceae bacterium]
MTTLDWVVVGVFMLATMIVGLVFARRASKSTDDFFVGGRSIPWWLAGTSMLATSFASDTPLHTTRAIREGGLAQAWFYWNGIIGGVLVTFVFSKLWRRAAVVTDNELIELRYAGRAAATLRGGLAVFKSFFLEIITMAWITLGMVKIVTAIMGLPPTVSLLGTPVATNVLVVAVLLLATMLFSVASGFWGVVTTDLIEFTVAMTGAVVLAVIAMVKVGGAAGLKAGLAAHAPMGEHTLDFTPGTAAESSGMLAFGVYLGMQWWARYESDGSGQRAQRFLACKDENAAIAAGIWNLAVQWLIRSWPWYLTALASLVLYPHVKDHESVYPTMVADLMPVGLKGLMVASFFAAFMGTMEAHYNMTASYALNDVYRRFIAKGRSDQHYVKASRYLTFTIALFAGVVALLLPSVMSAFRFKMEMVAGVGLVLIGRWLWWRVTARTEIAALLTSIASALVLNVAMVAPAGEEAKYSALRLLLVTVLSAVAAVVATWLGKPEPTEHLVAFYRRVKPPAFGWRPIAALAGDVGPTGIGREVFGQSALALFFVFGGMIGIGKVLLGDLTVGVTLVVSAAAAGWVGIRWMFRA